MCVESGGILAPGNLVGIRTVARQRDGPLRRVIEDREPAGIARFDIRIAHGDRNRLGLSRGNFYFTGKTLTHPSGGQRYCKVQRKIR